jgi:hypothetical protein
LVPFFFRYHSNPLAFFRSWEVEDTPPKPDPGNQLNDISLHTLMDSRFEKLENQFIAIANLLQNQKKPVKHKGRGKKSKKTVEDTAQNLTEERNEEPIQSTSQNARVSRSSTTNSRSPRLTKEAMARLNAFMGNPPENDLSSDLFTEDLQSELTGVKRKIYIQKVDCQFNGNSIDSLEDKATADQAMQQFWRMYYFNGQLNSLFSNGLTYSDFLKGYFFCVYDLSTSNKSGSSYLVPAIRVGHLRMRYYNNFQYKTFTNIKKF